MSNQESRTRTHGSFEANNGSIPVEDVEQVEDIVRESQEPAQATMSRIAEEPA